MKNFKNAFDWDITQTPIFDSNGNVINGYKEIKRQSESGDGNESETIAVMKKSFTPMTTAEFTDIVERISQQIGADIAGYEDWNMGKNIGARKHIITAQLRLTNDVQIAGSRMDGFMTIGCGFDGSKSFFISHSQEYLRCTNQFSQLITDFTSRLTKNNMLRVEDIVNNISLYTEYEKKLYENMQKMVKVKIDDRILQECVSRLAKLSEEEKLDHTIISTQKLNKIDDIMASMRTEISDVGNNVLGLFNGATHYSTHIMNSRSEDYFGNLFGTKGEINKITYDFCKELIN